MRKLLFVFAILIGPVCLVAAENLVIVQGSYFNAGTSWLFENKSGDTTERGGFTQETWGGTVGGYFDLFGGGVGLLASVGLYTPLLVHARITDPPGPAGETVFVVDVGAGYRFGVPGSPVTVIVGGGPFLRSWGTDYPEKAEWDDNSHVVMGLNLQASPVYAVSDVLSFVSTVKVGYSFLLLGSDPELEDDVSYGGGVDLALSFGVGIHL